VGIRRRLVTDRVASNGREWPVPVLRDQTPRKLLLPADAHHGAHRGSYVRENPLVMVDDYGDQLDHRQIGSSRDVGLVSRDFSDFGLAL
jgi:hypothetical protein